MMLRRCCSTLVRRYATFLYNYPYVFLIVTLILLVVCAIFSFVPGVAPGTPDFSKPTEGFEPRGTEIMKRIVTQQETLKYAINRKVLTCEPTQSVRGKRSTASLSSEICDPYTYRQSSVVTVYESGGDLFNVDDLKTICAMEENIVRRTSGFDIYCSCRLSRLGCGPSLSLGNYIAIRRSRSSCSDLTTQDVSDAKSLLQNCSSAYFTGKLSGRDIPIECAENRTFIENIFNLLVDVDFLRNTNTLKNTMVLSPASYEFDFARDIYDRYLSDGRPEQNGVKLVAFEFDNFKSDQFNVQLQLDAVFPAIGLIMVAIILLVYTHSILVMVLTVFSVITSIIIAYCVYHQVFRLTFFPFLNILTVIFLIGIGADDAFVFNDVWAQAKSALPNGSVTDWLEYTLKHAALSMFVTSFTTAAAFYANVVSDITAIRLFGIFSGTSILILYSLMITWFPAGIVFMEKIRRSRNVRENLELQVNPSLQSTIEDKKREPDGSESPSKSTPGIAPSVLLSSPETSSINDLVDSPAPMTENSPRPCPCRYYNIARSKCSSFMKNLFGKWIPTSLRGYPVLLIVFLALGIGMICAVTVSPGLERPKSADFQVFSSSHILEQYDLKYKNKFRLASSDRSSIFMVYIFFGFIAADNGNYLEPKNFGELEYDNSLDVLLPEAQKWFFESLCSEIRTQKFFGGTIFWPCFPEKINQLCNATLGVDYSLPLNETQLTKCIEQFYYRGDNAGCSEYSGGLYFQGNTIKGIGLSFPTNIQYTTEYATVNSLWEDIKDFQSSVLDKAPKGMRNGWAISWLRFYALQLNLGSGTIASLGVSLAIALCVMLLTSLNWVISLYAIVTIICILATTIGSLVLDGWELNILESIVISVAVGLSVDFTLHYGVAYTISSEKGRVDQVKYALSHIGPAVTLAALTTFTAGVFMMFSTVLVYFQLGQFLTLVMAISWVFATFFFLSLCYFAGPVGYFGQINSTKCGSCKVVD